MKGNIFRKYTNRALKQNKVRTAVTMTGIILSMALMTAVMMGAYSGIRYLIDLEIESEGSWNGMIAGADDEIVSRISNADAVKENASWTQAGWAQAGSVNEYKPYILINSMEEGLTDLISVRILDGRLPESSDEIMLPEHLNSNGGVAWKTGDKITLMVGTRVQDDDGHELSENAPYYPEVPESIINAEEKTFTVSGIYARFGQDLEKYDCAGYVALTGGSSRGKKTLFFSLNNPRDYFDFVREAGIGEITKAHSDLLMFYGRTRYGNFNRFIYSFAAILVFLIAFGSVSLIYNSFAISVSERTRQYGILKSVGATKKQIRGSVLYEAFILSAYSIPVGAAIGCGGIGLTLYLLRDMFARTTTMESHVRIHLAVSPLLLVITAAVCLFTTLISAWIPARRAMRVTPIEAIRQSGDIRIKNKSVRTSHLTGKLFGFEGVMASKNFKRNKKRYRSVIFSLSFSIMLFIAASSLSSYLKDTVRGTASATGYTPYDVKYTVSQNSQADMDAGIMKTDIMAIDSVDNCAVVYETMTNNTIIPVRDITAEAAGSPMVLNGSRDEMIPMFSLMFVDDSSFREVCRANGLDEDLYFDAESPMAIIYNHVNYTEIVGDHVRIQDIDFFDSGILDEPMTLYAEKEIEGYLFSRIRKDEDGTVLAVYMKKESSNKAENGSQELTVTGEEAEYPADEVCREIVIRAGALLKDRDYFAWTGDPIVMYPYSMMDVLLDKDMPLYKDVSSFVSCYMLSADHSAASSDIKEYMNQKGIAGQVYDNAEQNETMNTIITVLNVFSYGFIIVISLIAAANVFNTISTNINLRRREFAMLKSVGLSQRGFRKMMNYECLIYGFRGLVWGIPAAILVTWLIWRAAGNSFDMTFYIPWYSIVIAVCSVFAVVFSTMLYASGRIRRDNMIDALKNENI